MNAVNRVLREDMSGVEPKQAAFVAQKSQAFLLDPMMYSERWRTAHAL